MVIHLSKHQTFIHFAFLLKWFQFISSWCNDFWCLWLNPWCNGFIQRINFMIQSLVQYSTCCFVLKTYTYYCWFNIQTNFWLWTLWFSNSYWIFGLNILVMYVMAFDEYVINPFDIWIVMWMIWITKASSIVHINMNVLHGFISFHHLRTYRH